MPEMLQILVCVLFRNKLFIQYKHPQTALTNIFLIHKYPNKSNYTKYIHVSGWAATSQLALLKRMYAGYYIDN